jgi:hypothetical protein
MFLDLGVVQAWISINVKVYRSTGCELTTMQISRFTAARQEIMMKTERRATW